MISSVTFPEIIQKYCSEQEWKWVNEKNIEDEESLKIAFVTTPRFISKKVIDESQFVEGINCANWTLDELVRVYFILQLEKQHEENFTKNLNILFDTAENNEGVALVKSLQFLRNPENWLLKATDAVRCNVGIVFDAIAFQNTYPKKYFAQLAWNQMVLKCIFNDKTIKNIDGLLERNNKDLANSISNLAHERWSAGRKIPDYSWRIVVSHLDEHLFKDIQKLFSSKNEIDQIVATLVCRDSPFEPAKNELQKYPNLFSNRENYSWENFN